MGRFFIWAGLLLCAFLPDPSAGEKPDQLVCRTSIYDEKSVVKYVIDGDTIVLTDNRHVRLIGINTPEIGRDDRPAQPGADQAYKYLSSLLPANISINLLYDRQRLDRYKRTLAHLFLEGGANIQALLLERGLSMTLTIPPNLEFLDCYASSSATAQSLRIGLWSLTQYQPVPVELITKKDLGYRIITGKVTRVAEGKSSTWIMLGKFLSLRIASDNLHYFGNLQGLAGSQVRVRGLLYFSNGEFRMHMRHPIDMTIMEPAGGD